MDKLIGVDVVRDMFDLAVKQVNDGWIPSPESEREIFLDHLRKEIYKKQQGAKTKKRLNRAQIQEKIKNGSMKGCVFSFYGSVSSTWVHVKSCFSPAAANFYSREISVQEDGWVTHKRYPLLKMGIYA